MPDRLIDGWEISPRDTAAAIAGPVEETRWGPVEVQVVLRADGTICRADALEFPDGRTLLLTLLCEGQTATVLQLPAQPKTEQEAHDQERVSFVG